MMQIAGITTLYLTLGVTAMLALSGLKVGIVDLLRYIQYALEAIQ